MAINIEIRVFHDTGDTSSNPAAAQAGCTATCRSYYSGTKTYTGGHPKPGESGGTTNVVFTNYQLTATLVSGWTFKGWDVLYNDYVTGGLDAQGNVRTDVEIVAGRQYESGPSPYPASTSAVDFQFPYDFEEANPGWDWARHTFRREIIAIYAQFEQGTPPPPTYTITTAVSPSGAGTTDGDGTYNSGATATLTATANSGYQFLRWELNGTTVSTSATYSVTVTANATYTAVFETTVPMYHVQVVAFKSQAYVSLNGSPGDDIQNAWTVAEGDFEYGESITIAATSKNPTLHPFKAWYRDPSAWGNPEQTGTLVSGAGATYTTTVTADVVYFATFDDLGMTVEVKTYSAETADHAAPDAIVSINGQSDNDNDFTLVVVKGSTVVLGTTAYGGLENPQAWPLPMYFVGWLKHPDYDTILSDSLQYTVQTSQSDYWNTYLAKYVTHYTLNTSVRPAASAGTVSLSPPSRWGNNLYPEYDDITLTATASPGWKFKHWILKDRWGEEIVSTSFTITITVTYQLYYDVIYIAVFEWDGTDLLVNSSNLGSPVQLVYDDASGGTGKLIADY